MRLFPLLAALSLGALSLSLAPGAAHAQGGSPSVSGQFENAPLLDALRSVFKQSGRDYSIEPGVGGSVNAKFAGKTLEDALRLVLRSAGATYRVEGGVYVVAPKDQGGFGGGGFGGGGLSGGVAELPNGGAMVLPPRPTPSNIYVPPIDANGAVSILNDGKELFVVRGSMLYRVRKTDLKVLAKAQLR